MWDKHWERVDSFLKKWKMVQEGDSILLGISGGADSVCLARYFLARREALSLKLYAVHINHMLRGEEAKRDEEFVQDFCHKWNLSLNVEYRNIKRRAGRKNVLRKRRAESPAMSVSKNMRKSIIVERLRWRIIKMMRRKRFYFGCCEGLDRREWRAFCRSMERLSVHFSV